MAAFSSPRAPALCLGNPTHQIDGSEEAQETRKKRERKKMGEVEDEKEVGWVLASTTD